MRFGGLICVYNELPENLPRAIASMRKLCDVVVGYDDGSTDGSGAWMDQHLDHCFHGERNDWHAEIAHKKLMLDWLQQQVPRVDWILWLDADEALMPGCIEAIPRMIAAKPELTGIALSEINLWSCETHYRVDRQFGDAGFLRLWKNRPELQYGDTGPGLHQLQFPEAARQRIESLGYPAPGVLHYSWSSHAKIVAKYERYKSMGQWGEALERIGPDPNAVLVAADPAWFWPKES